MHVVYVSMTWVYLHLPVLLYVLCAQLCSIESAGGTFHESPVGLGAIAHFLPPLPQLLSLSFCYSVHVLAALTFLVHPSTPSSQLKNITRSTRPSSSSTVWRFPNSKCRRLEFIWNKRRVSRATCHLSKCWMSVAQCKTSSASRSLPAFLAVVTVSLSVVIVLKLMLFS